MSLFQGLKFRPLDAAVFLLVAGLTVLCAVRVYSRRGGDSRLYIKGQNGSWVYPLDRTERLEVSGPLGLTVVELSGGAARILSSPCANKICIASGAVYRNGQWAACLPNGVSLAVEGGSEPADSGGRPDAAAW